MILKKENLKLSGKKFSHKDIVGKLLTWFKIDGCILGRISIVKTATPKENVLNSMTTIIKITARVKIS